MSFELTILGSSSALPTSKRFPTAHLLKVDERFFLIDCGEGTQIQLRKFGFNPGTDSSYFYFSSAWRPCVWTFRLVVHHGNDGKESTCNLYGPETLEAMMDSTCNSLDPFLLNSFSISRIKEGRNSIYEDEKLTVTAHSSETPNPNFWISFPGEEEAA